MLTALEKKIIASLQDDIPVTQRPYKEMADRLGITEDRYLGMLRALAEKKIMRRFGATLRHQKSGFQANAMIAWRVSENRVETIGKKLAAFRQVSHCYCRIPNPDWPYNLYTMIHAKDERSCHEIAEKMARAAGLDAYTILFSRKELKKTSMKYFSEI